MEFKHVLELIDKIEKSNINSLELTDKEFTLKLEKNSPSDSQYATVQPVGQEKLSQNNQEEKEEPAGNIITAPIVGTFYQSPSPDKEPFVKVGQDVKEGDVVCIIEAMKLFNEVQSDYAGTVKKILVKDGDLLEYGQPIMIIG